ncbi:E3 ubiquitin-protein ligase listerin [Musca domestica]|uniref:E3 ubiquitin-protein ligase listerin n=1 Tax=Musca domestica TaxID=7370 RepID=A0A9J7I8R7_MUSDO|nr:E3 ubiquitin-protein ligase listerin [Musca domestica]
MGGKTKHAQRTKNNVKPSSSARSAELLGTTQPVFVGFSAHSDLGLIPFVPGFGAAAEQMPETFDASISTPYQLTLKKLSKKDPMTKKKALQEFIDLINQSDMDELKTILPLWPKFYQNLATDPEHSVRELTQTVLQILVTKCKKAIAPYLKQLVPVWLASQYDNYAPAASMASSCFNETFSSKLTDVCLHCQVDIIDYASRNLTFHTAATLSTGKSLTPEEAEQKYQRVVVCSLKELSFFVEHSQKAEDQSKIKELLAKLLEHQKFFSFAKNKLNAIKAAWFEFIYHLLQSPQLLEIVEQHKTQVTTVAFQNIDESDPLVAPHVWGCILLIQANFQDWPQTIDFREKVWPKFGHLLRNAFNRNAQAICPNVLPFFSQLSHVTQDIEEYHNFIKQFFDNLKGVIVSESSQISKQDNIMIIKTYFECLRYINQKINNASKEQTSDSSNTNRELLEYLLQENVMQPLMVCLSSPNSISSRYIFQNACTLVAFFDRQHTTSEIYQLLLDKFWQSLFQITTEGLNQPNVSELYLERVIELINDLYVANPSLEEHKVKFAENEKEDDENSTKSERPHTPKSSQVAADFRQKELKQLVLQLLRICMEKTQNLKTSKYIKNVRILCNMFNDRQFFAKLSAADESLDGALKAFIQLLSSSFMDNEACEIVVDVIFEILQHCEKAKRFEYIDKELIKISHHLTQTLVLNRLLSHPLCVEPEIRTILCQEEITNIISKVAEDVVKNNSKDLFNLLHKCFFETDTGEILISPKTVDKILMTLSKPLLDGPDETNAEEDTDQETDVDACGSFIAQIMPVVCSKENASLEVKHEVFLRLFTFSIQKSVSDYISEDTLWEITTCWQDALSSEDIILNNELLEKCALIIDRQGEKTNLTPTNIDSIAEATGKFVTCSTENISDEKERYNKIDHILQTILKQDTNGVNELLNVCLFIESLKGLATPSSGFTSHVNKLAKLQGTLQRSLLNFSILSKLVCGKPQESTQQQDKNEGNDDEITEDYCDPNENLLKVWSNYLQMELLKYINIAAAGDSLINQCADALDTNIESLCLEFSEKVQFLLRNSGELSITLKELLMEESAKEQNLAYYRSLPYLVNIQQYSQFEESGLLLLAEDLQEYFAQKKTFKAYMGALQYLLPKLEAKTIDLQCPIMRCEPNDIWIKAGVFRALLENNFSLAYNEKSDQNIISVTVQFITEHSDKLHTQKDLLLYQSEIFKQEIPTILNAVEYIKLLSCALECIPHQLTIKNWDVIRIGLGHWILSVTKSLDYALENADQKSLYFTLQVFKLFAALTKFFDEEKQKSSTELLKNVYDEWLNVFSRDVYLTIFKTFYKICQYRDIKDSFSDCWQVFLVELTATMEYLDYGVIYTFCKSSSQMTLDHVCNFLLKNLSSPVHSLRTLSMHMMRNLTPYFVADDIEMYDIKSEQIDKDEHQEIKWHFLNRFEDYIGRYDGPIRKYLQEFSFKLTEISEMQPVDRHEAFSYLMLWDCIIYACAKSPVALRSVYTTFLHENKYEENLLHFLFRCMPVEILKNHSTKQLNNDIFKGLTWSQIKDNSLSLEKYTCHLYTDVLSKLPAVVRKWWNTSPSRQKTFVDTLTTNFVSPIICQEELMAIAGKKDKHENMQVTVHISTREVLAVYSIDEARMELVITLASNYPLGSVKVDCNKQIGGRASSRNVAMQLTIFLTHQNGTIFDGLALWKNNLDKKFEGVEECYVCYTVIHQDTCQLPKLTCKTCKKKFHGPCLYKWFTTSSKSTCPICRNVF